MAVQMLYPAEQSWNLTLSGVFLFMILAHLFQETVVSKGIYMMWIFRT